ncbi:MAG: type II secretion system protein GspM [Candidatus Rokuibacteriota bacterium]
MIGHMSGRERSLIGLAVLVGATVLGWQFVAEPIRDRYLRAAELVPARQQVLVRRTELVARKASIVRDLEATEAQLQALSGRFLTASTPAVAASELQKLVKEVAGKASTEIRSERILPPVERGELVEIPLEVAVSAEVRQLVDILAHLEQAPKLLTVQDIKIRVINVSQPKDLLATITLSGFILPGKPKS